MASFQTNPSISPSQTLHSLDPNSAGLRHRRNGGPDLSPTDSFRPAAKPAAAGAASAATRSTLLAPPPRSSLCLQTSAADPVTPIKKSSISAGFSHQNQHPFSNSGLFPAAQASTVSTFPASSPSLTAGSSSWVCVYGIDASIQDLVLDRFASYGRIVHQKSLGVNAVAIRYDNPLSAGKALCQNRFVVRGRYCGTFPMSDNDTSLLAMETTPARLPGGSGAPAAASLFAPSSGAAASSSSRTDRGFANATDEGNADEDDIFQHRKPLRHHPDHQQERESLCLRVMRWLLALD